MQKLSKKKNPLSFGQFLFLVTRAQIVIVTQKFLDFSHLLFSLRLYLLTTSLNIFFSAILASSRNSLSIESQKSISTFFRSSICLMLASSKLNWVAV